MQFNQNLLIHNKNVIHTMESIEDDQFNFIYLDLPWYTGHQGFIYNSEENKSYNIATEDINEERLKLRLEAENKEKDEYGNFVSKILENSMRILKDTGILVFRAPIRSVIDYKLMLDQIFSSTYIMQITLETRIRSSYDKRPERMNHEILYFYSKTNKYTLNKVYEDYNNYIDEFNFLDDRDRYNLKLLTTNMGHYDYVWKGIRPNNNRKWRYSKEKMDQLFEDKRIVIKDGRAFLKYYMKEHPREKSSVWGATVGSFFDIKEKLSTTMSGKHFIDLLKMTTSKNDWIFSPYDVDQKLPVIAQNLGRKWVVINANCNQTYSYKEFLKKDSYEEVTNIQGNTKRIVYNKVLKDIDDINDLKQRLARLDKDITIIKKQLGLAVEDEEVVIEQIQEKIDELIEKSDIEQYIPVVQEWIKPFWERLEAESKRFLPTAELLYQEYKEAEKFDLSIAMLSYCKALEKEIYSKMFKGYIKKLIEDGTNVERKFPKDFKSNQTKRFARRVSQYTTEYKDNENQWKFELGTMVYILRIVLKKENVFLKEGRIYRDFKNYLEQQFEHSFFDIGFMIDLDNVVNLRNASAHPQIITPDRIDRGKEIAKKKIVKLLSYYNME